MPDLDNEIRRGLERLTEPVDPHEVITIQHLESRRGQHRTPRPAFLLMPIVVVTFLVVVTLALTLRARDQPDVAERGDAGARAETITAQLTVENVVVTGAGTTSRVELAFDNPLPDVGIKFVENLNAVDTADEIIYTVQPASAVKVCDSIHSFPPPADGTVDVLLPASWFAPVAEPNIGPVQQVGRPAKFVPCGPYEGLYQYSIWGPVSTDPSKVSVKIENGGRRLVVSITP